MLSENFDRLVFHEADQCGLCVCVQDAKKNLTEQWEMCVRKYFCAEFDQSKRQVVSGHEDGSTSEGAVSARKIACRG